MTAPPADFEPRMVAVAEALRRRAPGVGWRYAGPASGGYERFSRVDGGLIDIDLHMACAGQTADEVAAYIEAKVDEWAERGGPIG